MKNLFLLVLVCALAIQLSHQQRAFKPQKQTTGPFGTASGTAFNFNMDSDSLNTLPSTMTISHGAAGINSISFTYQHMIGQTVAVGGRVSGGITETELGRIVGAQVCTGRRSGSTVIIGLKFTYENGITNYFHGNLSQVSGLRCVNAAPTTQGYYLQSLSGRYGTTINQLQFYWVSNFAQEEACRNNPNCNRAFNYCPSGGCCYQREQDPDGTWSDLVACA